MAANRLRSSSCICIIVLAYLSEPMTMSTHVARAPMARLVMIQRTPSTSDRESELSETVMR